MYLPAKEVEAFLLGKVNDMNVEERILNFIKQNPNIIKVLWHSNWKLWKKKWNT